MSTGAWMSQMIEIGKLLFSLATSATWIIHRIKFITATTTIHKVEGIISKARIRRISHEY
jgi:hypothetical protein